MIQGVLAFLSVLPELLKFVSFLVKESKKESKLKARRERVAKIRKGIEKASREKDTSELEALF